MCDCLVGRGTLHSSCHPAALAQGAQYQARSAQLGHISVQLHTGLPLQGTARPAQTWRYESESLLRTAFSLPPTSSRQLRGKVSWKNLAPQCSSWYFSHPEGVVYW